MVGLFGKAMEPLGGGALLEEVSHTGWALRASSGVPLPVYLCFLITATV